LPGARAAAEGRLIVDGNFVLETVGAAGARLARAASRARQMAPTPDQMAAFRPVKVLADALHP
jgi:hypothetical protein